MNILALAGRLLSEARIFNHETVFIDGTKIESCAGRYTFCWRGTIEKNLQKVQEKAKQLADISKLEDLRRLLLESKDMIEFVSGKGRHKSEAQRQWKEPDELRIR